MMKRCATLFALSLAPTLAACGADELSEPAEETPIAIEAAASANAVAFRKDWSVGQRGSLVAGQIIGVEYDASRLPGCRGNLNGGQPGWTITGYASVNRGPAKSFWVAGFSPTGASGPVTLKLAARGDLAMWFQITNRWGCSSYDSNFGHNFHFTVR